MDDWTLLHEDESLLVVNKPAGLLAVPGRGDAGRVNLTAAVQQRFADALIVHRLDQATSGLMLFARGGEAQRRISMAFEARAVGKQYLAVVEGHMDGERGEIAAPLITDWPQRPRQKVCLQTGKPALTRWQVLSRGEQRTLVQLEPVTGRSHQLRVHLLSVGHPIVGDTLYGTADERLHLHASRLVLSHPMHGRTMVFESSAPFGLRTAPTRGAGPTAAATAPC